MAEWSIIQLENQTCIVQLPIFISDHQLEKYHWILSYIGIRFLKDSLFFDNKFTYPYVHMTYTYFRGGGWNRHHGIQMNMQSILIPRFSSLYIQKSLLIVGRFLRLIFISVWVFCIKRSVQGCTSSINLKCELISGTFQVFITCQITFNGHLNSMKIWITQFSYRLIWVLMLYYIQINPLLCIVYLTN